MAITYLMISHRIYRCICLKKLFYPELCKAEADPYTVLYNMNILNIQPSTSVVGTRVIKLSNT